MLARAKYLPGQSSLSLNRRLFPLDYIHSSLSLSPSLRLACVHIHRDTALSDYAALRDRTMRAFVLAVCLLRLYMCDVASRDDKGVTTTLARNSCATTLSRYGFAEVVCVSVGLFLCDCRMCAVFWRKSDPVEGEKLE